LWHICRKPRHVARQWHNKRVSATAVTSLNNEAAAGSSVFHAVRSQADTDATAEHVTLRRKHQQSNCKKKCFLWGPPRGYVWRTGTDAKLVRSSETVCLQAGGPGPWRESHGQSSAVLSRQFARCKDARTVASWQRHKYGCRGHCWDPLPGSA
jgi:hypothetical protein